MTSSAGLSPEALLRDEARARKAILDNITYDIALDLTEGEERFGCETTIRFTCSEPGASTFLDYTAPEVVSITLNGNDVPVSAHTGFRIPLADLEAENELKVVGTSAFSRSGTGLHFFRDPVDKNPYLHTQCEAREAHKIFPCFDQPDLKATFQLSVRAPGGWKVISNTDPDSKPTEPLEHTWNFARSKTMSTYLFVLVAGPYHEVRRQHRDIDMGLYCRKSMAQYMDVDDIFLITAQGFDFFEEYFDYPYMWGKKYDQLFVPEFNSGAMENCAAVTFNEAYLFRSKVTDAAYESRASTILHEMAHMWFGDLVTMDWWDDLWLNESFATYMAAVAAVKGTRFTSAWVRFAQSQKLWAMTQDQMPTTHPIVADAPDTETARTNFDGISYAKGASVLKQLVAWVGEEPFVNGVRQYFRDYEYGNANLADFLASLEKASGRDLTSWAKEWLETAGIVTFRAAFEEKDDTYTSFALEQTASEQWPTLRSHRLALGLYDLTDGKLVRRERVELDVSGARMDVPQLVGTKVPDFLMINDEDLTFAKIRLDPRSLQTLTDHLAHLEDPLTRTLSWAAAVDQLRDAELPARLFVRLVLNNIHTEDDPGAVQTLLNGSQTAITLYSDPANADALRLEFATRAKDELLKAAPGSDLQLLWGRALVTSARSEEHITFIRGLLDGTQSVEGLAIDTELRWSIVKALAGRGAAGEDLIDAEFKRDPTDQGERHAAQARAMRPTPEAKAEAWERILDPETPLATMEFLMAGFYRYDQADLCRPYEEKFFAQLMPMWESRPVEVAVEFAASMYPGVLVEHGLVERTSAFLDANSALPPPIRRYLIENQDQLKRALRARERDTAAGHE
ncbi:MAG TPA: aminopeptidase N [Actinomycetota bacterium]|nr:aminopeptidase N [Actinomycetota bacterium]